jgi:hypothetical protein
MAINVSPGVLGVATISCNPNETLVGGGFSPSFSGGTPDSKYASFPMTGSVSSSDGDSPDGWGAWLYHTSGGSKVLRVYAVCVS